MKKGLLAIAFGVISFSVFPCSGNWNACGGEDIEDMVADTMENCCAGTYTITDICNGGHVYVVTMSYDGPSSSCMGG